MQRGGQRCLVFQRGFHDLDRQALEFIVRRRPAARQHAHAVALGQQRLDQALADEAGPADDKDRWRDRLARQRRGQRARLPGHTGGACDAFAQGDHLDPEAALESRIELAVETRVERRDAAKDALVERIRGRRLAQRRHELLAEIRPGLGLQAACRGARAGQMIEQQVVRARLVAQVQAAIEIHARGGRVAAYLHAAIGLPRRDRQVQAERCLATLASTSLRALGLHQSGAPP